MSILRKNQVTNKPEILKIINSIENKTAFHCAFEIWC